MKSKNIVRLDYKIKKHIVAASWLHSELLPDSPIHKLGWNFMTKFYYNILVKDGLIICDLYKHNGRYLGFLSYTKRPFSFMREGKNKNFLYLLYILMISVITRPSRIKVLLDMLKVSSRRNRNVEEDGVVEFLSFGVLKPYRHILDQESGLRIADLLFQNGIEFFKNEGCKKVIFSIIKKDNEGIFTFYRFYGVSFIEDTEKKTGFNNAFIGTYDLTKENERLE